MVLNAAVKFNIRQLSSTSFSYVQRASCMFGPERSALKAKKSHILHKSGTKGHCLINYVATSPTNFLAKNYFAQIITKIYFSMRAQKSPAARFKDEEFRGMFRKKFHGGSQIYTVSGFSIHSGRVELLSPSASWFLLLGGQRVLQRLARVSMSVTRLLRLSRAVTQTTLSTFFFASRIKKSRNKNKRHTTYDLRFRSNRGVPCVKFGMIHFEARKDADNLLLLYLVLRLLSHPHHEEG